MTRNDVIRMAIDNDWRPSEKRVALEIYDAAYRAGAEAAKQRFAKLAEGYDELDTSGYDTAHSIARAILEQRIEAAWDQAIK